MQTLPTRPLAQQIHRRTPDKRQVLRQAIGAAAVNPTLTPFT